MEQGLKYIIFLLIPSGTCYNNYKLMSKHFAREDIPMPGVKTAKKLLSHISYPSGDFFEKHPLDSIVCVFSISEARRF
jgi:hypothetical protein